MARKLAFVLLVAFCLNVVPAGAEQALQSIEDSSRQASDRDQE